MPKIGAWISPRIATVNVTHQYPRGLQADFSFLKAEVASPQIRVGRFKAGR